MPLLSRIVYLLNRYIFLFEDLWQNILCLRVKTFWPHLRGLSKLSCFFLLQHRTYLLCFLCPPRCEVPLLFLLNCHEDQKALFVTASWVSHIFSQQILSNSAVSLRQHRLPVMKLDCLVVLCDFRVESIDERKPDLGEGQHCCVDPPVGVAMTARNAFSREETTWWQHACKTLRRKKKRSPGLVKKKTQESCFTAGRQMLLTRLRCLKELCYFFRLLRLLLENFAWSTGRLRAHVTWFGRVISRAELTISTVRVLSLDGYCLRCGWRPQATFLIVTFQERFVPAKDAPSLDFVLCCKTILQ